MTQDTPPAYIAPQPLSQSDERLWATLIHIGGIFISFIAPLIGYLVLKDRSSFVKEHSRTALNFQITMAIAQVANLVLGVILGVVTFGLWFFAQWLISIAIWAVVVIFSILAAVAANKGEMYRYPLTIQFVK
jgi:uncharacterized protein